MSNESSTKSGAVKEGEPIIKCEEVHKWYGNFHVLRGVNMNVQKGEVVVVFGPSGSGKSTFIRCINRLEEHQKGHIIVDGIELSHDVRNMPLSARKWAWSSSNSTCSRI